jgi:hypothetical protein
VSYLPVRADHDTRQISASIRRKYGYPAPYRGPTDDILERLDALETLFAELRADEHAEYLRLATRQAER